MKVALLVMKERRAILDHCYDSIKNHLDDCTIFRLTDKEQMNYGKYLSSINYKKFDRIVIVSRLKKLEKQVAVFKCIPGLVFIEYDAYQNYMADSKYMGKYSLLYKATPWVRVISSGSVVAKKLSDEGIDAVYVTKGYDETQLKNLGLERDIDAAFLGSLTGTCYIDRRKMLDEIAAKTNLLVTRTESGEDYLNTLNRIKIFVSADISMGEYMIKNYEAMACGCVLMLMSQGEEEDKIVGFSDMENVVFYTSPEDAANKIAYLKNNPNIASAIAAKGQLLAESKFSLGEVGRKTAVEISKNMREIGPINTVVRYWAFIRYGLALS